MGYGVFFAGSHGYRTVPRGILWSSAEQRTAKTFIRIDQRIFRWDNRCIDLFDPSSQRLGRKNGGGDEDLSDYFGRHETGTGVVIRS